MAKGKAPPIDYVPANTPVSAKHINDASPIDVGKDFVKTGERTN